MKFKFFIFLLLLFSLSLEDNEIIQIPYGLKEFDNILSRYGTISSKLILAEFTPTYNDWRDLSPNTIQYNLININNSHLFTSYYFQNYQIYNDSISIKVNEKIFNKYWKDNNLLFISFICEVLFRTKYIDKFIYSIGKNENNEKYTFFGGVPENLVNNLNICTLGHNIFKNENIIFTVKISDIKFEFNDGNTLNIKLYKDLALFDLNEDIDSMICLSESYYNEFYKEYEQYTKHNEFKHFSISFQIDDKRFILNETKGNPFDYINICERFFLGKKFLGLFDYREYNLETKEVHLYLNKNKKYLVDDKIVLKSSLCPHILLFSFFILLNLFTFVKIYRKNKGVEFYYYYDINNI